MLLQWDVESRGRVNTVEVKAKVLVEKLPTLEAQVKELEIELRQT